MKKQEIIRFRIEPKLKNKFVKKCKKQNITVSEKLTDHIKEEVKK